MTEENPFSPPAQLADSGPSGAPRTEGAGHTPLMVAYLSETRPWVFFLAILGFIVSAFMVIGALAAAVAVAMSSDTAGMSGLVALIYLPGAGIYVFLSVLLVRFASAITHLEQSGQTSDLEEALLKQKTIWKTTGILAIVSIGIFLLAMVGVMIAAAAGVMGS